MANNEIDNYTFNILKKQLQKLKLNNQGLYSCIDNVNMQLSSIVKHWNEPEYLNAIFITVTEDGSFYEPEADNFIKNMVALGVRNSLIEIAASKDCKQFGLAQPISDDDIIKITVTAIEYFKTVDLNELQKEIELDYDYYYEISRKYKCAFEALWKLANNLNEDNELEFKVKTNEKIILEELNVNKEDVEIQKDIQNGISKEISGILNTLLKQIYNKETDVFYVDSFKRLSRNYDKNMRILEFIITNDAWFITNNFLIAKGYVSKRPTLMKAGRGNNFNKEALSSLEEVSKKYKNNLRDLGMELKKE